MIYLQWKTYLWEKKPLNDLVKTRINLVWFPFRHPVNDLESRLFSGIRMC